MSDISDRVPTTTRDIDASAEAVWAVLADGWMYATWVVGASRLRDVDLDWPAEGSRIHHSVGVWPVMLSDTTDVVRSRPLEELVLTARAWPFGEAEVALTLTATSEQTCTVSLAEDAAGGPGRLVPRPLRQLAIVPRNVECLRRLAFLAEGRHREGATTA